MPFTFIKVGVRDKKLSIKLSFNLASLKDAVRNSHYITSDFYDDLRQMECRNDKSMLVASVLVGPCHHGMARPQVADRGTASDKEGSCE